jgi:hypothetical protein
MARKVVPKLGCASKFCGTGRHSSGGSLASGEATRVFCDLAATETCGMSDEPTPEFRIRSSIAKL